MSVNDKYVMQSWLSGYSNSNQIKAIADGNAELAKILKLSIDKSENYMGIRCVRFAMIVKNGKITNTYFDKLGHLENTSAEAIYKFL